MDFASNGVLPPVSRPVADRVIVKQSLPQDILQSNHCAEQLKARLEKRSGVTGPYHKLQQWENGKNTTRYVPADEVCQVQAALAGYAQYRQLTEEYAQVVIAETRQNIASKKKNRSHRRSSWPKTKKSKD